MINELRVLMQSMGVPKEELMFWNALKRTLLQIDFAPKYTDKELINKIENILVNELTSDTKAQTFTLKHSKSVYKLKAFPETMGLYPLRLQEKTDSAEEWRFAEFVGRDYLEKIMESVYLISGIPAQIRLSNGEAVHAIRDKEKFCLKENCSYYLETNCLFDEKQNLPLEEAEALTNRSSEFRDNFQIHKLEHKNKSYGYILLGKYTIQNSMDDNERNHLNKVSHSVETVIEMINLFRNEYLEQSKHIRELNQLKEQIYIGSKKYQQIVDNSPLGIFSYTKNGKIIEMNQLFVDMVGSDKESLLNFGMMERLKDKDLLNALKKCLNGEMSVYKGTYKSLTADKATPVRVYFNPIFDNDNQVFGGVGIVEDISQLDDTEKKIQKLNDVFLQIGSNPQENIDLILKQTHELLNGACSFYNRLDDEDKSLVTWADHMAPPDLDRSGRPLGHICYEAAIKGFNKPVAIENLLDTVYKDSDPNVLKYNLKSYLGYPVQLKNKAIGSLCIVDVNERKFSDLEIHIISTLAKAISLEEERIDAYRVLGESEEKLRRLIENTEDAVILYDEKGQLSFANPATLHITGLTYEEFQNEPHLLQKIVHEADQPELKRKLNSHDFQETGKLSLQYRFCMPDNKTKWIWHRSFSVRNEQGKLINYIVVLSDISSQKETENELIRAKIHAQESDRLKTNFLANIGHELRTPMNAVLGFAEVLKSELEDQTSKDQADMIISNANRLQGILNDIIDVSLLESGKLEITPQAFSVNETIRSLHKDYSYDNSLRQKNIRLLYHCARQDGQDIMISDASRIRQMMSNLLNNAIRHTNKGYIELGYKIKEKDICFYVQDTGSGIREDRRKNLFERFYSDDDASEQQLSGLGLGLFIVSEIAHIIGGRISFETKSEQGTRFEIALPFAHSAPKESEQIVQNTSETMNKSILIVEDVDSNFLLLRQYLKKLNYRIIRAETGLEAIKNFRAEQPDLVLMDIRLPKMSGIEAMEQIKEINPDVPVIAQTAHAMAYDREKLIKSGFDDYIAKPIKKQELLDIIEKLF